MSETVRPLVGRSTGSGRVYPPTAMEPPLSRRGLNGERPAHMGAGVASRNRRAVLQVERAAGAGGGEHQFDVGNRSVRPIQKKSAERAPVRSYSQKSVGKSNAHHPARHGRCLHRRTKTGVLCRVAPRSRHASTLR